MHALTSSSQQPYEMGTLTLPQLKLRKGGLYSQVRELGRGCLGSSILDLCAGPRSSPDVWQEVRVTHNVSIEEFCLFCSCFSRLFFLVIVVKWPQSWLPAKREVLFRLYKGYEKWNNKSPVALISELLESASIPLLCLLDPTFSTSSSEACFLLNNHVKINVFNTNYSVI